MEERLQSALQNKNKTVCLMVTYRAHIAPSAPGFCEDNEKRKFELKNLFWLKKLSCALACCDKLTLGRLSSHLSP